MAELGIRVAGDPVLRQKAKKIRDFGPATGNLIQDMLDTLHAARGLGLAAPQIGVPLRVIVIEMPAEVDEDGHEISPSERYVYCNPEIIESFGEEKDEEGCLSVPNQVASVKRATAVTVKGLDAKGRSIRTKAEGLLARAFQHETDHLNGVLILDRIESPEDLRSITPSAEEE
jgi:peptide deformylase